VSVYVDAVLRARDILHAAGMRVVGYDLYPRGAGALLISADDRERAFALLSSDGIHFTTTPTVHRPPLHRVT
jgi:hypothetical protein